MPDYSLIGLSSRSFEQMIQALSCKLLGPGVVVFGDGPDGGREATFQGQLSGFPSEAVYWDGYLVLQAKFRQRPSGKVKDDSEWAVKQLRKELDAFAERSSKRKKPEYYIFATNVVLSSIQGSGGKDRISSLIEKYRKALRLKDYRIWDYDQICRFLDGDASVRTAYTAWLTTGDVLAKLAASIEGTEPDFPKVMTNFLQKEILDDYFSKLEQAGHSPENRIPLEEVFIDLPSFRERRTSSPEEVNESKPLPPGFLAHILDIGSSSLRPEFAVSSLPEVGVSHFEGPEPGRFVLVGGPGQGKSTIAQFLCQIHRASLLNARRGLDADARKAVKSIITCCEQQDLTLGLARRFPVRIELARFAKALAKQAETGINSLLSYVKFQIEDRTNFTLGAEHLRRWLQNYPWLVILDGLDEVPASSNRGQVMTAIRDFLVDVSTCNADVLLLATTRPQGYNDEFSPQRYEHRWLAPLSIPRALHYGKTLVELTYAHSAQRKKEVHDRLADAVRIGATARLMESPLQVTIMARLLAQVAQPPHERYKLFQQYYKVIYRREMERGVAILSQLLRDYEEHINAIHYRTGLLLQIESERARYTDATISSEELKAIVADRLQGEGHKGEELARLTEFVASCATDRLVFLVPSQSDRVGFEIRSLQEFMAAEALMDGADDVVIGRIKTIAAVPYWQNVLLFGGGKCFAERQWLRDSISQVCSELNDDPEDTLTRNVLAGSRVAVSLLEDGPARRQPRYAQALARRALALLALPPEGIHTRLAEVYEPAFESVYKDELDRYLSSGQAVDRLSAWRVLIGLVSKGIPWAEEAANSRWPSPLSDKVFIFETALVSHHRWLAKRYEEVFFRTPVIMFFPRMIKQWPDFLSDSVAGGSFRYLVERTLGHDFEIKCRLPIGNSLEIRFGIVGVEAIANELASIRQLEDVHTYWRPLVEAAKFVHAPSARSLALALRAMAAHIAPNLTRQHYWILPWPVRACLEVAKDIADLQALAERAEAGQLGDLRDWKAAEKRWMHRGLTKDDLIAVTDDCWPFPPDMSNVGFPFTGGWLSWSPLKNEEDTPKELGAVWKVLSGSKPKAHLARSFFEMLFAPWGHHRGGRGRRSTSVDGNLAAEIIAAIDGPLSIDTETLAAVYLFVEDSFRRNILDLAGRKIDVMRGWYRVRDEPLHNEHVTYLLETVENDSSHVGILRLLSQLSIATGIVRTPSNLAEFLTDEDQDTRRCSILLQCADRHLDELRADELVGRILSEASNDQDFYFSVLKCFENHQMDKSYATKFLQTMWKEVPKHMVSVRGRVIAMLSDLLGRRRTRLQVETVWEELRLPSGLLSVLVR